MCSVKAGGSGVGIVEVEVREPQTREVGSEEKAVVGKEGDLLTCTAVSCVNGAGDMKPDAFVGK